MPSTTQTYTPSAAELQRKVEDLERLHNDTKKACQAETERLKIELARLQKGNVELSDRLDKQKGQKDLLELRMDELKRNANVDKAEIKDLGVKLRLSEQRRTQMTAKHGEFADMKKALQSLESKRKDELKNREKTLAELQKSLSAEKRIREMVESQLKEVKTKHDSEAAKMKTIVESLKTEIVSARDELQSTQRDLETATSYAQNREQSLLRQFIDQDALIGKVVEQFGMLASSTVSKTLYEQLRSENSALQIQVARLFRKLGNTEGQVSELAYLIRQSTEENQLLRRTLRDMEQELASYYEYLTVKTPSPPSYTLLDPVIANIGCDQEEFEVMTENLQLQVELYQIQHHELLSAYASAEVELQAVSVIASRLPEVAQQRDTTQDLLQATSIAAETLRASSDTFKRQVNELEMKLKTEAQNADKAMRKEKDTVHRLTTTIQKLRMAEDGLRAENEQITMELTDAERFQEAYYSLSEELEGLLARKALAEDEAQRLSKLNAEILGHRNPAQRIVYVEKIRNELAETRQKLLISTRAHETVITHNQELQHELDMYKSITVPYELRPGGKLTRMNRPPLVNLNKSFKTTGNVVSGSVPDDMMLDEIS